MATDVVDWNLALATGARLAPNGQQSLYPWKDTKENTRLAVRHARTFLKANRPA